MVVVDKQDRNKDENLIGAENAVLNSIEGKRDRELVDVERKALNAIAVKSKEDLDWYKFQFYCIIKLEDATIIERLKVLLGTDAWDKIVKECKEPNEQTNLST